MSKVSRQHPAFSFAHPQKFGVEDTGDIELVLFTSLQSPSCGCSLSVAALLGIQHGQGAPWAHTQAPKGVLGSVLGCSEAFSSLCQCMGRSGVPSSKGGGLHHTTAALPALPGCWHTWRRAALPSPVCAAGPQSSLAELWVPQGTAPARAPLPRAQAGSLQCVLLSPGCGG